MVDTVRTLAALQALLADNTAGDISAQDVRDLLVSAYPSQWFAAGQQALTNTAPAVITTWAQWGTEELDFGDWSGDDVSVFGVVVGHISTTRDDDQYFIRLQASFNGGSTWTDGRTGPSVSEAFAGQHRQSLSAIMAASGSATGAVQFRAQQQQLDGGTTAGTFANGTIAGFLVRTTPTP